MDLTPEERKEAREAFEGSLRDRMGAYVDVVCVHCAGLHDRVIRLHQQRQPCPRVRRIEFHGNEISSVEYWPEGRWDDSRVIYPHHVYVEDEVDGNA
jgi:hypothetical protein